MKVYCLLLLVTLPYICHALPVADEKSLSLEDTDAEHGESVKDSQIAKRSGSFDYVTHLKSGLLSSIGHASASIASGSSGHSSGGESYKSHEVHVVHGNSVDYDPWSFKKSVLNTIFQAVKAITGGVTALKGQLIKGSGYALSASGNLVAAGGDKVTDVGKAIINSAHINSHTYGPSHGHSSGSGLVHPFAKLSSLSGASSGGSSGGHKHTAGPGPVVHSETITTYEIPTGHSSYGPPASKPPTYSSATHQYLPPAGPSFSSAGGVGGGAPFTVGHAAFEAPQSNYLPTAYGQEGYPTGHIQDDFNVYGRHKKLTDHEARKAAAELQEILKMLPDGKTEYTASKTVTLDTAPHVQQQDIHNYGLPAHLGPLESLSHTESITAAYAPQLAPPAPNAADIYHQMARTKQTPEEIYIQKHPNEGYDYQPARPQAISNEYKFENYHAAKSNAALKDLTPIIAALETAKRKGGSQGGGNVNYAVEKSVHKVSPYQFLPPVVQKSKYTFSNPGPSRTEASYRTNYRDSYKVRRHVGGGSSSSSRRRNADQVFRQKDYAADYEIQDSLLFNRMLEPIYISFLANASFAVHCHNPKPTTACCVQAHNGSKIGGQLYC